MTHKPRFTLLTTALVILATSSTAFAKDVFLTCAGDDAYGDDEIIMAFNESEGWIKQYYPDAGELRDLLGCTESGATCTFSADTNQIRYEGTFNAEFVGTATILLSRRTGAISYRHDGVNAYGRKNETVMNRTCRPTNDPREAPALF